MNSDPRVDPPEQPKTTELPAVPDWAVELLKCSKSGFTAVNSRLDSTDVSLEKVVNEGIRTNTRLSRVEERLDEVEGRIGRASSRVRDVSSHGLESDAQIARQIAAHEELSKKVDSLTDTNAVQLAILARLDKVASNPLVKTLATILATAITTWLATKGIQVAK